MGSVCITVPRIGPYHRARCDAAGKLLDVHVVETSRVDSEYAWDEVTELAGCERHTLFGRGESYRDREAIAKRMWRVLDELKPCAVAVTGWALSDAVSALAWCVHRHVPAIVMSESQERDQRRSVVKEAVKRRVVGLCRTALAGGTAHAAYLRALGMPRERVFLGYDVVDNAHFAKGADAARGSDREMRRRCSLPIHYFLASSRFVPKKNIRWLIRAFAEYRREQLAAWDLVLLGDGPGRAEIEEEISRLQLVGAVHLPGFQQYDRLPIYYGLAGAFVHASVVEQWGLVVNEAMAAGLPVIVSDACGCARDLVEEDRNGFTFSPDDPSAFAGRLRQIASDDSLRARMGACSRQMIAQWTPDRFGQGLKRAVDAALALGPIDAGIGDRILLSWLSRRASTVASA